MARVPKKLPYKEGTWFVVPLRNDGFAIGNVARMRQRGRVVFGYFFGPRWTKLPALSDTEQLTAVDAIWLHRFSDLALIDGRWPILGHDRNWHREHWPMPPFGRREPLRGMTWKVTYPNDDMNAQPMEMRVPPNEIKGLPVDGMAGNKFVEQRLTRLLHI